MHGRTITMEAWAEVYGELEFPTFGTVGSAAITAGEHPHLGAVVAVQTTDNAVVIASELPFTDEIDRRLAEQDDAITSRGRQQKPAEPTIEETLRAAGMIVRAAPAPDDEFGPEIDPDDLADVLAELDRV